MQGRNWKELSCSSTVANEFSLLWCVAQKMWYTVSCFGCRFKPLVKLYFGQSFSAETFHELPLQKQSAFPYSSVSLSKLYWLNIIVLPGGRSISGSYPHPHVHNGPFNRYLTAPRLLQKEQINIALTREFTSIQRPVTYKPSEYLCTVL